MIVSHAVLTELYALVTVVFPDGSGAPESVDGRDPPLPAAIKICCPVYKLFPGR